MNSASNEKQKNGNFYLLESAINNAFASSQVVQRNKMYLVPHVNTMPQF